MRQLALLTAASLSLGLAVARCSAQEAQPAAVVGGALEKDAALAAPLSLEAVRMPLGEMLTEMQKQSGVALTSAPGAPQVRVTARLKQLPLAQVMNALSRLYGVTWTKQGDKSYRLEAATASALQLKLLQMGNAERYLVVPDWKLMQQQQAEVAQSIIEEADPTELSSPEGVPLSALSAEVQNKVRSHVEGTFAQPLLQAHSKARAARDGEWTLRFQPHLGRPVKEAGSSTIVTSPGLVLLAPDGSSLAEVPIAVDPPQPADPAAPGANTPQ